MAGPLRSAALVAALTLLPSGQADASTPWVAAWATGQQSTATLPAPPTFVDQTVRMIVHPRADGRLVRIRLSNTFGDRPVTFGRSTVGLSAGGGAVVTGTLRAVTFGGAASTTVPAGREALSDPLRLNVKAGGDLAVSVYLPTDTGPATYHRAAYQTNYVSVAGDHTGDTAATGFTTTAGHYFFLDSVSVGGTSSAGTVVALGDSITDGSGSAGSYHRWPDVLAGRIFRQSVVDEGIAGNKVLSDDAVSGQSVLHRLDRDVLSQPGLRTVIMLEGINDLRSTTPPATAAQIIAGYRQIIARVHARGARILGATITPVEGSARYDANMEQQRQAVNTWIRTSHAFDGVVDFAATLADPADQLRLLPAYDSGDHLHPDNAGYQAMGNAVDLKLLR
ncbi:SGNH/GDSL hydrolase family protein [Kutzneria sp. NPDC051319]|uniref:SGNH/GDSL hydrolase family protein n=1 Tax=Kutzneria sp. NPDC051319 TaxID=3155047 RepID=UPI00341A14AA